MFNFPQYTDMSPEIREATAKINAAYERFKACANGPQPDRAVLIQMQRELEQMADACPQWIKVDA